MDFVLPPPLVQELDPGARVVEVGVGGRWQTLEQLARDRPDLQLAATDLHPRALEDAPSGVETFADDVFDPRLERYRGAALLFAVRCPEELQPPLARLARQVSARLALHVLKDERATLAPLLGPGRVVAGEAGTSWRVWGSNDR